VQHVIISLSISTAMPMNLRMKYGQLTRNWAEILPSEGASRRKVAAFT
jgi:hypothetical protein